MIQAPFHTAFVRRTSLFTGLFTPIELSVLAQGDRLTQVGAN
jgi:hypothetical protein